MFSPAALTLLLSLSSLVIPEASATYLASTNWGVSSSLRFSALQVEKESCSGPGSFFTEFLGKAICCSDKTRTPPRDITCPKGWSSHKDYKICIPPVEVGDCECGEGFGWLGRDKKCKKNDGGKCSPGQWWHDRSGSCCDDSWEHNPPKGDCDEGKSCPGGWFWHKQLKKCKPQTPHAPAPDCGDWDNGNQCCGGHGPEPSKKPNPPNGGPPGHPGQPGNGGGYGGHPSHGGKRDFMGRQQDVIAPVKPFSDLDKLYCPAGLHACSVPGLEGSEWAYECIDFANELESCGGCASTGEGQDCSAIPNAVSVGCEAGSCAVYSCLDGFAINGTSCVSVL